MKLILVNPKNTGGKNYIIIPNIGLGYLSSAVKARGHQVDIVDCMRDNIDPLGLSKIVRQSDARLIGFTVFTVAMRSTREYLKIVKQERPDLTCVLGGAHPSFEPQETMDVIPEADYLFCGESEVGFPPFVDLLEEGKFSSEDLSRVPGLVWRQNGNVRMNPNQLLHPLDLNPFPDWQGLEPHRFPLAPNGVFSRGRRVAPLLTTRGCPFDCMFCGSKKIQGAKIRKRTVENILEEMSFLRDTYRIDEFHIMDDNFTLDREFALGLCRAMTDREINVHWACTSGVRLDTLNEVLLKAMERAGCYSFAVGIESGSDKVLQDMKKKITTALIEEKVTLIKRCSNIKITGFFIIGYPTETHSEVEKTIRFSCRLPLDRANFFNFSPFPGSAIYYELKEAGRLGPLNYDDLYIHTLNYDHPHIPKRDMSRLLRKAYFQFYLRPRILYGLATEIKSFSQISVILKRVAAILSRGSRSKRSI